MGVSSAFGEMAANRADTCCVSIQGLYTLEDTFEGKLCHNAALSQFEGSSTCSPQMRPSFPSFWRMHRYCPSWPHIAQDLTFNNGCRG